MKYILPIITVFFLCFHSKAQQLPMIGTFSKTQLYYNPAYAGSSESVRGTLLHRAQWRNVPGAPTMQLLVADAPVGKNMGAGLVVAREQMGSLRRYDVMANAAYRLYVNPESYFQGGIRVGVSMISLKEDLFQWDGGDPLYNSGNRTGSIPRIGAGIYYKTPIFYAGISAPDLLSVDSKKIFAGDDGKSMIKKNYTALAGARANISEYITLIPSALVIYYPTRPVMIGVNMGLEFNQTVTATVGFTTPSIVSLSGMVGLTTKLKVGYRYEVSTSATSIGKFSTNEFLLSYGLN